MSIVCLSHVMRHSEAQLGARLVLFVLAEHAHDDGSEAYPSVETLMERTRMSRRAVQCALRKLEADSAIEHVGLGPRGQRKYRVLMGGADIAPAQDLQGAVDDTGGRSSRHEGGAGFAPEPSVNRPEPNGKLLEDEEASAWAALPDEMRLDAEELLRRKVKVNGALVTEREVRIAAIALAEFNRQMGADFGLGAQLVRMVMRIRERPSWDAAKHVRLVQSAWRIKWWERNGNRKRATPQVIWGNGSCFEHVAQDAADERAGKRIEIPNGNGVGVLKQQTWPDGRTWDELTRREQENAKESFLMGYRPWDRSEEEARLIVPSGHAVTGATFLNGG